MTCLTIVVMGVSSCGKSTIGKKIADELGLPFSDGDDLHEKSSLDKMASGIPLNDEDRRSWLEKISEKLSEASESGTGLVIACSALKMAYRNILRSLRSPGDQKQVIFVYLKGSYELFESRMAARKGHFMPTSLLKSQFDTLEEPYEGEVDEGQEIGGMKVRKGKVLIVEASQSLEKVVEDVTTQLKTLV